MPSNSRRKFINNCLKLSAGGLGAALIPGRVPAKKRKWQPAYLKLHQSGELKKRGQKLWAMMKSCRLCPRQCGIDRLGGDEGFCKASAQLELSGAQPHFGEERCLVGRHGSGTVFFTNCGLRCVFCINWRISVGGMGRKASLDDLARAMLALQARGCHNINVVTPTHYSPHILLALDIAARKGLRVPVVYNTCGWERLEILKIFDGVVDIYMPDFKYAIGAAAAKYSSDAKTYPEITQKALLEMHRQVGVAKPGKDGLLRRGLIIRHLVMPHNVCGTDKVLAWIANHLPKNTYVNLMSQYRPMYQAHKYPKIARRLTRSEFRQAVAWAKQAGLTNVDIQRFPLL